jgi:hypothetical protein
LIIVLDSNGNAEGDLFYDDGESLDTISSKSYFYGIFKWSSNDHQLTINLTENNYPEMSNLILDSLNIYGLDEIPNIINVNNTQFKSITRPNTQIIEIRGLGLSMNKNHTLTWQASEIPTIQAPGIVHTDPKYRVDCYPDPGEKKASFFD